jgi:hypothetical protein
MRHAVLLLICASFAVAQEEDASLAAWKKLQAEYNKARGEYYKARREGDTQKLERMGNPFVLFGRRYKEFAEEHAGTAGGRMALNGYLRLPVLTESERTWAVKALLSDHLDSADLADTVFALRSVRGPDGIAAYRVIAAKSPHARVRGLALLHLGKALMGEAPDEAKAALNEVVTKYADEVYFRDRKLGPAAEAVIFELEHLAVGMEAPEIEGEDLDGGPMKLSEFRGKVVLLDFWGDW